MHQDHEKDAASPDWVLSIFREAKEEDLEENHFLEMLGETIWETKVKVLFCPYCGTRLAGPGEADFSGDRWIKHFDFSGWNTRIR